jgi:hypothetical protein
MAHSGLQTPLSSLALMAHGSLCPMAGILLGWNRPFAHMECQQGAANFVAPAGTEVVQAIQRWLVAGVGFHTALVLEKQEVRRAQVGSQHARKGHGVAATQIQHCMAGHITHMGQR